MKSTWINMIRNALSTSYLPVMVKKVLKRAEADTREAATQWAIQRAISIDEYCRSADPGLWDECQSACQVMKADADQRLRSLKINLGGGGAYPLLYFLVRRCAPRVVVETGVAAGWSSRAVLEALQVNGAGRLYSSDFPYFRLEQPERYVGFVVPDDLRRDWHLDIRGDERALPAIIQQVDSIDLFHYDSDKSASGRKFALDIIRPKLSPNAVILMDDIQDNTFFRDYVESEGHDATVFEFEGKFIGAVGPTAMTALTLRIPEEKHLTEFDAETRFRLRAERGLDQAERGLALLRQAKEREPLDPAVGGSCSSRTDSG